MLPPPTSPFGAPACRLGLTRAELFGVMYPWEKPQPANVFEPRLPPTNRPQSPGAISEVL
jgi:hypothetical protein